MLEGISNLQKVDLGAEEQMNEMTWEEVLLM